MFAFAKIKSRERKTLRNVLKWKCISAYTVENVAARQKCQILLLGDKSLTVTPTFLPPPPLLNFERQFLQPFLLGEHMCVCMCVCVGGGYVCV